MVFNPTAFLFELVNFGLLLWILQRILYRPLREGIERRRSELAAQSERSAAEHRDALALRREAEDRLAEIQKLRDSIIADAREQAAKEEARILEQAREDAEAERERVGRTLERERGEALVWIREGTIDNAVEIAGRLMKELLPDGVNAILLDALVNSLKDSLSGHGEQLAPETAIDSENGGHLTVELTMACPPPEAELEALRNILGRILDRSWDLVIRQDPTLIAGAVLRLGDQVLDASISGHLSVLRERARELAVETSLDV